jgi:hypothetical protein
MFWENAALFAQVVPDDELAWGPELRQAVAALPLPAEWDLAAYEDVLPSDPYSWSLEGALRATYMWRDRSFLTSRAGAEALSAVLVNPNACELLVSLDGQFDGTLAQFEQLVQLTHV